MAEVTHKAGQQVVSSTELRRVLRAAGKSCFCRHKDYFGEWDAGICPEHDRDTSLTQENEEEP